MRLSKSVSLAVTAVAALAIAPAPQAFAEPAADRQPTCGTPEDRDLPVRTRIHGGPAAYDAGGRYRTWYIDLTNTTDDTCGNIHPIVVLVDEQRALKPGQPRLEFYDGERLRPVPFERTDEDENIGVFGSLERDGFPGFTVASGATLSVEVRLAVTSDAVPNDVVATAAVVQRHDDDGDWVGESNDYRFRILDEGTPEAVREGLPFAEELAGTGLDSWRGFLGAMAGVLLLLGAGVLLAARRRR